MDDNFLDFTPWDIPPLSTTENRPSNEDESIHVSETEAPPTLPELQPYAIETLAFIVKLPLGTPPSLDDKEATAGYQRYLSMKLSASAEILKHTPPKKDTTDEQGMKLWAMIEAKAKELSDQLAPGQEEWRRNHPECFPQVIDADSSPVPEETPAPSSLPAGTTTSPHPSDDETIPS